MFNQFRSYKNITLQKKKTLLNNHFLAFYYLWLGCVFAYPKSENCVFYLSLHSAYTIFAP